MTQRTYRTLFSQFLNDYWGAFHEALEAQSVNPQVLADSLFAAVTDAHERFATAHEEGSPAIENLGRLWTHVRERRTVTREAPLTAREVQYARAQFETLYDTFAVPGAAYSRIAANVISHAVHGTPRTVLRADAAR